MKKLVGEVVVRTLSKWKRDISHEQFKKTAKEVSLALSVCHPFHIFPSLRACLVLFIAADIYLAGQLTDKIAETEMRGKNASSTKFDKLSDEKIEKVKKFVKLSATKLIARQKKRAGAPDDTVGTPIIGHMDLGTPGDGELNAALTTPDGVESTTPNGSPNEESSLPASNGLTPDGPTHSLAEMQLDQESVKG